MAAKAQQFVPKGMKRDHSASKADPQFAFENHNIRITARDSSSLLSITNEKGNIPIDNFNIAYNNIVITTTPDYGRQETLIEVRSTFKIIGTLEVIVKFNDVQEGNFILNNSDYFAISWRGNLSVVDSFIKERDRFGLDGVRKTQDELPTEIPLFPGTYMGHCILNEYVTLFLHRDALPEILANDYIIRLANNGSIWEYKLLWVGDLGFKTEFPLETLSFYENLDIQKVYWVDGIHQPRYINIVDPDLDRISSSFDFTQEMSLGTDITVTQQTTGGGSFPSGVIQYVCTYSNLYGSETAPFYISELFYIAPFGRGGNPEEKIACSFKIQIDFTEKIYHRYIRIYSIIRTSLDAIPTTKLLTSIPIKQTNTFTTFIDLNTSGSNVDPAELLYKGGDPIYPYTMEHKDNTLFFGNYMLGVQTISQELKDTVREASKIQFEYKIVDAIPTKGSYPYLNTLNKASSEIKTFHSRECYRFGIQFLHKTGVWSEVIFVGDSRVEIEDPNTGATLPIHIVQSSTETRLLKAKSFIPISILENLSPGYIGARGVVVYPDIATREVVCQGIVCPTVYSAEGRLNNKPFAQSSWFARSNLQYRNWDDKSLRNNGTPNTWAVMKPIWENIYKNMTSEQIHSSHLATIITDYSAFTCLKLNKSIRIDPPENGSWREFRHNQALPFSMRNNAEIQYMGNKVDNETFPTDANITEAIARKYGGSFFVDQSIITLHSPDIEFDTSIQNLDLTKLKFRVIGQCFLTGNSSDQSIIASSPGANTNRTFSVDSSSINGIRALGVFPGWKDSYKEFGEIEGWLTYPWHRSGSLSNATTPTSGDAPVSRLKNKILSNLRFSATTTYLSSPWSPEPILEDRGSKDGISGIAIYRNDGNPILKLPVQKNYIVTDDIVYYGEEKKIYYPGGDLETDQTTIYYPIYNRNINKSTNPAIEFGNEPVIISYKSTPHAVLAMNYNMQQEQVIMPTTCEDTDGISSELITVNNRNAPASRISNTNTPFWIHQKKSISQYISFLENKQSKKPYTTFLNSDYIWWTAVNPETNKSYDILFKWRAVGLWYNIETDEWITDPLYIKISLDRSYKYINSSTLDIYYVAESPTFPYNYTLSLFESADLGSKYGVHQEALYEVSEYGYFWLGEIYRDMDISARFGGTSEEALKENKWTICGPTMQLPEKFWTLVVNYESFIYRESLKNSLGDPAYANKIYGINDKQIQGRPINFINTMDNKSEQDWVTFTTNSSTLYIDKNNSCTQWDRFSGMIPANFKVEYTGGDTFYQRYDCLKTYGYDPGDENTIIDVTSFMCETRVNLDGRYDRNRGNANLLAISPTNFNLLNPVYSQQNSFFPSRYIDSERFKLSKFPNSIVWTRTKNSGEEIDPWTSISLLSNIDMDGDKGGIEAIRRFNNELYCFQPLGISRIFFNSHAQMLTQGQGGGAVPVELMNSGKVEGKSYLTTGVGSSNKWSIVATPTGLYFIDNLTNSLHLFTQEGMSDLSDRLSFRTWVDEVNTLERWDAKNFNNVISFFDSANSDVYFITNNPNSTIGYSEVLGQFTSFYNYDNVPLIFPINGLLYSFKDGKLWQQNVGEYNSFYGEKHPYSVEVICNMDEPIDKIFNTIEWRATVTENGTDSTSTFDTIRVTTDGGYQDTGEVTISDKVNSPIGGMLNDKVSLRRKFRMWRIPIPRDNSIFGKGRDRMRGPWAKIKLSKNNPKSEKMELHDMAVHFFE